MTSTRSVVRRLLIVSLMALAAPSVGGAQPATNWPPFEVWLAAGPATWSSEGRIDSDYAPPTALFVGDSRATQTLTLDPETGRGFDAGINVFPWRHVGFQAFAAYSRADLSGVNGPYDLQLDYISRPPPSYDPVPVSYRRSFEWPDTLGELEQWSFGGGVVARARHARVGAAIAGGVAWHRLSGESEQLGFTVFHLGGHSTLFYDDFRLRVALGPTTIVGAYAAGEVDVEVARHVALVAGARACFGAEHDVSVQTLEIVESVGGFEPPALADIDTRLGPPAAQISPAGIRLFAGIKVR